LTSSMVETIVKWRMGAAYDAPILNWRDRRLNFGNASALFFDNAGAITIDESGLFVSTAPGRQNYNPLKRPRLVEIAEDLFKARMGAQEPLSAFAAMQDARLFPSVEYVGPPVDAVCAQLSYARTVQPHWRSRTEVILWPLAFSHRYWKLPDRVPTPWDQRRPELFWRGQAMGMSYVLDEDAEPILTGIRSYRKWLVYFLTEEAAEDEDVFDLWAPTYQRLHAVSMCRNIPDTDVRFVPMYNDDRKQMNIAAKYLGASILAERLDKEAHWAAQQARKYILCLPGNDIPTSLRMDLLSGGVTLMPRPFWESDWFFGLTPHVHYIPLRADLADLEERLEWCRNNDRHCKEVAEAARAFALERFEPSIEFEVQKRIVERMARQTIPIPAE
jgi:hypothetical protein